MTNERKTRDLCQDCWQEAHPTEYFPDVIRYGECARCGWRQLLVARSTMVDEVPASNCSERWAAGGLR